MRRHFRAFLGMPPHDFTDFTDAKAGGDGMRQEQKKRPSERMPFLRIEPEKRLCPAFDPVTIAEFPVAEPGEMGFRVLDNFCEEHIQ